MVLKRSQKTIFFPIFVYMKDMEPAKETLYIFWIQGHKGSWNQFQKELAHIISRNAYACMVRRHKFHDFSFQFTKAPSSLKNKFDRIWSANSGTGPGRAYVDVFKLSYDSSKFGIFLLDLRPMLFELIFLCLVWLQEIPQKLLQTNFQ